MLVEHELANVERFGNLGEGNGHELTLMMLELVHVASLKERAKVGIAHELFVKDIHGSLESGLSAKSLQERTGLLLLLLLGALLGLGSTLLEDGSYGNNNISGLLDLVGGDIELLQRGDEMASDKVEVNLAETLEEQPLVLVEHEFLDVDALGDGGERHAKELALVLLESFDGDALEEVGKLVIGDDLAVEDVDSRWRGTKEKEAYVKLSSVCASQMLCAAKVKSKTKCKLLQFQQGSCIIAAYLQGRARLRYDQADIRACWICLRELS